jgi:hypothetical protein
MTANIDTQLPRAVSKFPQSAQLADRARKLARSSKK